MKTPPIAEDTSRSINERFVAYLDAMYAPRDVRRRYLMVGALLGLLLMAVAVTVFVLSDSYAPWLLFPIGAILTARNARSLYSIRKAREPFHYWRNVIQYGTPVTAYIVQAHESLYHPGRDTLPCLVLFSFQPEVESDATYMHYLAERIFALKNTDPNDPDRNFLAGLTTDERPVPYRRRRLPFSFTDGSTVYCADLWVKRAYLKDGCLKTGALLCLAETGEMGGIELIPSWLLNDTEERVLAHQQE